jgi:hypothetical protein
MGQQFCHKDGVLWELSPKPYRSLYPFLLVCGVKS